MLLTLLFFLMNSSNMTKIVSAHLVSNDKIQVESARKFGVEAYYLLEEFEKVKEKMTGS